MFVLFCFKVQRLDHISATRSLIEMGFGSKFSIVNMANAQVIYVENSTLNIPDIQLIPLVCVTYAITENFVKI